MTAIRLCEEVDWPAVWPLLRATCARLAHAAVHEAAAPDAPPTPMDPYQGQADLWDDTPLGRQPRWRVEWTNTTDEQHFTIEPLLT